MRTFTDTQGRSWSITITVDTVKRVRALTGTDLLAVAGGDLMERLAADPVLLADVLFAVVKPEAEQRQITEADFGRALAGDAIAAATTALLEDLVDFFPNPKRALLRTALAKLHEVEDAVLAAASARLAAVDATSLAALPPPGRSSGASPVSSESTPVV